MSVKKKYFCGSHIFSANKQTLVHIYPGTLKGSIVSPKYPFPYPPKQSINYTIETNNGFQIELKFDSFRLEFGEINETSCEYDNLR